MSRAFDFPYDLTVMKVDEIRKLSTPELQKMFRDTGEELMNLRLRKQTGQVEKPHMLSSLRRERARINTILAEKSANLTTTEIA